MKKLLLTLIVLTGITISIASFSISTMEKRIGQMGYTPQDREIYISKIVWTGLSHATRPINQLTLHLTSFPPRISIQGMTISALPQHSAQGKGSSINLSNLPIDISELNIELDSFPEIHDLQGSLSPQISVHNETLSIQRENEEWNISGQLPIDTPNVRTTLSFSLVDQAIQIKLLHPTLRHEILEKQYQFPDIQWTGTLENNRVQISSTLDSSNVKLQLIPDFTEPNHSEIILQAAISFADLVKWFSLERKLRPKEFRTEGSILLTLHREKATLKEIHFDAKSLDVQGELFPEQQLREAGIYYRPIHADASRLLGVSSPQWVPFPQLGWLKEAVIAAEDSQFYLHDGINRQGIQEALQRSDLNQFSSGGSSITQQLAKNIFLHNEKTLERKLLELIFSISLERKLSKDTILALYLNAVEFGPNIYGAKQAAAYYFMKSPQHLTVREAVFLASLLPNPLVGHDEAKRGSIANYKLNLIIDNMYDGNAISIAQQQLAKKERLQLLIPK